jgi:hypothetical protein
LTRHRQECICNIPHHEIATSTTTTMNDRLPPPGSKPDPARVAQRRAPLSVTTTRPQADGSRSGQLLAGKPAQPPSPLQRTMSDPFPPPSPSQRDTPTRAATSDAPKPASSADKSLRFARGGGEDSKSPLSRSEARDKVKKGHSHKRNMNGYTECGRHSNDWLFGGFSASETVKKLWHGEKKE